MWASYVCLSPNSEDSQSNYNGARVCTHLCALSNIRAQPCAGLRNIVRTRAPPCAPVRTLAPPCALVRTGACKPCAPALKPMRTHAHQRSSTCARVRTRAQVRAPLCVL